jgi:3-oxoacyl-[acyl-carrier-protein] synthase II
MPELQAKRGSVVITGVGPVTAIGIGFADFSTALAAGRSGIGEVTGFDVEHCRCKLAAEIIEFGVKKFLASEKGYLDRNSALAFAATRLCLDDASFSVTPQQAQRIGLCFGTCFGNIETARAFHQKMVEKGPKLAPPFIFPHTYNNTTASLLAIEYGIKGPHANFSSGAAAGAEAIAYAVEDLRAGRADVILAGGAEALSQPAFAALDAAGKLRAEPSGAGFVLGEGACMLVLETEEHARGRGARIRARVAGVGVAGEASAALRAALRDADVGPDAIRLVVSSANGSADTDAAESRALSEVLGRKDVTIVKVKSLLGDTIAASGPLGLAAALAAGGCALVVAIEPQGLAAGFVLR